MGGKKEKRKNQRMEIQKKKTKDSKGDSKFTPQAGMAFEDARDKIAEIVDPDQLALLSSKKFREALGAIDKCIEKIEEMGDDIVEYSEAFFYMLDHTPTWKPTNFQVG